MVNRELMTRRVSVERQDGEWWHVCRRPYNRCVKRYVTIITKRMLDRREMQPGQQMVDEAINRIQYEIDHRPAVWTHGIGRATSYLAHMKALLNVSRVRRVNRDMILEVLLQAREQLEDTWGHA